MFCINFFRTIKPCIIWFTGLSGSGKSTLSQELSKKLKSQNIPCVILDENKISPSNNIGELACYFEKQGFVVIVSSISPYKASRDEIRAISGRFIEVYLSTPLTVCEHRDTNGKYSQARSQHIQDFPGVSSPYEYPSSPEITLDTEFSDINFCIRKIMWNLRDKKA